MDGFEGNGGGYGNDDGTRDFFSQLEHSSAFNLYSDPPAQFLAQAPSALNGPASPPSISTPTARLGPEWGGTRTSYATARTKQMARAASPPLPCASVPSGVPLAFEWLDSAAEEAAWPATRASTPALRVPHGRLHSPAAARVDLRPPHLLDRFPVAIAGPILRQLIRQPWRMTTSTWIRSQMVKKTTSKRFRRPLGTLEPRYEPYPPSLAYHFHVFSFAECMMCMYVSMFQFGLG